MASHHASPLLAKWSNSSARKPSANTLVGGPMHQRNESKQRKEMRFRSRYDLYLAWSITHYFLFSIDRYNTFFSDAIVSPAVYLHTYPPLYHFYFSSTPLLRSWWLTTADFLLCFCPFPFQLPNILSAPAQTISFTNLIRRSDFQFTDIDRHLLHHESAFY